LEEAKDAIIAFNKTIDEMFKEAKVIIKADKSKEYIEHLANKSIKISENGSITQVISEAASNCKSSLSFATKFLFAPAIALATIQLIPHIMKRLFPNHKKNTHNKSNLEIVRENPAFSKSLKNESMQPVFAQFVANQKLNANRKNVSFSGGIEKLYYSVSLS